MKYDPVSDRDFVFTKAEPTCRKPGTWSSCKTESGRVPLIRCGKCGGGVLLDTNHTISDDGKITPSVGCPFCGWHIFGRLEGW
jgi:hypothetical protein